MHRSEKLGHLALAVSTARGELDSARARWLAAPPGERRACAEAAHDAARDRYVAALEAYVQLGERLRLSTSEG